MQTEVHMGTRHESPDIIIIDDDESTRSPCHDLNHRDDVNYSDESSGGFSKFANQQGLWRSEDGFSIGHSEYSGKSYDDDCFVVPRGPINSGPSQLSWRLSKRVPKGEKRPVMMRNDPKYSCSSSDCEIIEDLDGKIRQDWERAALKKRFGNSYNGGDFQAKSEESTSAAGSGPRRAFFGNGNQITQHSDRNTQKRELYESGCSCNPSDKGKDSTPVTLLDQQDSNHNIGITRSEDTEDLSVEETSMTETSSLRSANNRELSEEEASCSDHTNSPVYSDPLDRIQSEHVLDNQGDDSAKRRASVQDVSEVPCDNLLIVQKAVREFPGLDCVQCQDSRSQAKGAHSEQKRRRLDIGCKLEIEIKQKQRLEDIRLNQQEEERSHGFKEQIRGQVQSELEDVAASAMDMVSLLRNLGVEVDGGIYPTIQQVNAAYKRALLRFDPDQVTALAKSDLLHQVQAEETFKLISKMKATLKPVALF